MTTKLNRSKDAARKLRRVISAHRVEVRHLAKVLEGCSGCDYDEAEGGLLNYCAKCNATIAAQATQLVREHGNAGRKRA